MAAGLGAAVTVASALALLVGYGTIVGGDVLVNPPQPIDANNSPAVARNPRRPDNLVVAHRVDRPAYSAGLESSFDGGATWRPAPLPLPEGADRPFGPDVAFGPDGTLYVLYVNLEGSGNTPANLWLATSSNGGESVSGPVQVAGKLTFQPRLTVDSKGTLHITWLQAADVGLFRLAGSPNPIVSSRSSDGGRTFSAPVQVSDPGRERVGAASPVVDSAGRLVVLYQDFKSDARDFDNLEGPAWEEPFALVVTTSVDGAQSFSPGVEVDSGLIALERFLVFLPRSPSIAAGPDAALYVAWADGRNGDDDVFLRRSGDGGTTWSAPVRVSDNPPGDGISQFLPAVAVADNGRVDVVFLERRGDTADAYLASSSDQGGSFSSVRLSSRSFDPEIGPDMPRGYRELGSRLGISAQGSETFAAWTDTRAGSRATGRQDIVAVTVERLPLWPILVWPAVAAVVVGGLLALMGRRPAQG